MANEIDLQKILSILDGKTDELERLDQNLIMETVGVAMSLAALRESLDKMESHLDIGNSKKLPMSAIRMLPIILFTFKELWLDSRHPLIIRKPLFAISPMKQALLMKMLLHVLNKRCNLQLKNQLPNKGLIKQGVNCMPCQC